MGSADSRRAGHLGELSKELLPGRYDSRKEQHFRAKHARARGGLSSRLGARNGTA
jgi:hypothetical protein